ncbi:MAG: hypothetical protein KDH09_06045, partial [Chrysiogenetes bacterium]|nr:hypothetical protein [Chrysiogenetes bacterium]
MARAKEQTLSPWLQGPASDLLLGCGLLYAGIFAYLSLISADAMLSGSTWLAAAVILLTGVPHYGATLLRVIEHPQARARYRRWTIWSGLIVWGIFALGLYQQYVGSLLLTTYLCWSPWHYTLQNYGIALMFLRRRGIETDQRARRLLYASFILSFALTMIVLHGQAAGGIYVPIS